MSRRTLAQRFSELIAYRLGDRKLNQVIELNAAEPDEGVCHTHDFIDAYAVMADAAADAGLPPIESMPEDPEYAAIVDDAWLLARRARFDPSRFDDDTQEVS